MRKWPARFLAGALFSLLLLLDINFVGAIVKNKITIAEPAQKYGVLAFSAMN